MRSWKNIKNWYSKYRYVNTAIHIREFKNVDIIKSKIFYVQFLLYYLFKLAKQFMIISKFKMSLLEFSLKVILVGSLLSKTNFFFAYFIPSVLKKTFLYTIE